MRTFWKFILVVLVVLLVLVIALPAILSMRPVRQYIVKQVNARMTDGSLAVDDWSLGWRRGIQVRGVAYVDGAQRVGGSVASISVSSGLLKLLAPKKDLGTVTIVEPHFWCDATRIEAAPSLPERPSGRRPSKPPSPAPSERLPLALDVAAKLMVQDARLEVRRAGQPQTTLVVNATVDCTSLNEPVLFDVQGHGAVGDSAPASGAVPSLTLNGSVRLLKDGTFDPAAVAADLVLQAKAFDLSSLALARAYVPSLPSIRGQLDSALTVKVASLEDLSLAGDVQLRELRLEGGVFGMDRPQFDTVRLDVDVSRRAGALVVRQLSLKSPLGTLKAAGELMPVTGAPYPRGQLSLLGDVDLAAVAAQVPNTLRLPPATQVSSGRLQLDGRIVSDAQMLRMQGKANLRELGGQQNAVAFHVNEPIDFTASAALTPQGPVLESFTLRSSFATAAGSGSATGAVVELEADLAVAAQEIDQIVDLGALRLGGRVRATVSLDLQVPAEQRLIAEANVQGLTLAGLSSRPGLASVPDLNASLQARATVQRGEAGALTIAAALHGTGVNLQGGALGEDRPQLDQLNIELNAKRVDQHIVIRSLTVTSPLAEADVSGNVRLPDDAALPTLDLQTKLSLNFVALSVQLPHLIRLQPGVRVSDGVLRADAKLGAAGETFTWDARAEIDRVAATRGEQALRLSAPISLESRGSTTGEKIRCDVVTLRAGFAQLDGSGDAEQASLVLKADLDQAQSEFAQFIDFGKFHMGGQLHATIGLTSPSASERQVVVDAGVDQLVLTGLTAEPLTGPFGFKADVVSTRDKLKIQRVGMNSAPVSFEAAGELTDPKARRRLQLQGTLSSDCEQIALLVEAFAGHRPDMAGKASRDFTLDTELGAGNWQAILRRTEAKAGLHADRYQAFGVHASDLDLALSVHTARVQVVFDTAVNAGRLHAAPYLDVSGEQTYLAMPTNAQVLSNVTLTEAMASELLARIHPIFYGCAVLGGQLSLTLDHLRVPLGPALQRDTTFAGDLRFQNLVLGAGQGVMGQLLEALHVSAQEVQVSNQVVRFECRDGRVTPSPLIFKVDRNKTIIVSGSVGLDQTLQYQVELPVTTNLLADLGVSEAAPYLKATSIKVPIGGTVTSPRFDRQAFARALKELGAQAARNAVVEEGGKLLGEFLKKRGAGRE